MVVIIALEVIVELASLVVAVVVVVKVDNSLEVVGPFNVVADGVDGGRLEPGWAVDDVDQGGGAGAAVGAEPLVVDARRAAAREHDASARAPRAASRHEHTSGGFHPGSTPRLDIRRPAVDG